MKRLQDYIVEADLTTITDFIQDKVDHPKDNEKTLKKMYNAANEDIAKQIKDWSDKEKFFSVDQRRCIHAIFNDYDQTDALLDIIQNPNDLVDPQEILNNTKSTLLEIIKNSKIVKDHNIEDDMIKELMDTQPGQGGVTVGPAEIALMIFVQGCKQNNKKSKDKPELSNEEDAESIGSDLIMGKGNYVEVKGREAMFCGQKNKPQAKVVLSELEKIKINLDGTTDTSKGNKYLLSKFDEGDEEFIKMFCNCFSEYYNQSKYFNDWKNLVLTDVCKEKKARMQKLLISISLWGLMEYQATEKFNNILLINTKNSSYPFANISFNKQFTLSELYKSFKDRLHTPNAIRNASRKELPKITLVK